MLITNNNPVMGYFETIKKLQKRLAILDSKLVELLQVESETGLKSPHEKAQLEKQIAAVCELLGKAQRESAPPLDSAEEFLRDFETFAPMIAVSGAVQGAVQEVKIQTPKFTGSYIPVRGDGNCGIRAFLAALGFLLCGLLFPNDPLVLKEWICRLKVLMKVQITKLAAHDSAYEKAVLSIPENKGVVTLNDYFALMMADGYYFTNFEFQVLAIMFGYQINVIRQYPTKYEEFQCFVPINVLEEAISDRHLNILYQGGHYVPLTQLTQNKNCNVGYVSAREVFEV